jgi:hypothetical protein
MMLSRRLLQLKPQYGGSNQPLLYTTTTLPKMAIPRFSKSINHCYYNSYNIENKQAYFTTTTTAAAATKSAATAAKGTKELSKMTEEELKKVRIDQEMLMRDLHESCEWGVGVRWGR